MKWEEEQREVARRSGRERSCGKKVRYGTATEATRYAYYRTESHPEGRRFEPYPCPWCDGYHIGGSWRGE